MHFHEKCSYFDSSFAEVCSYVSNCQQASIDLGNDLVPNMWQTIKLPEPMLTMFHDVAWLPHVAWGYIHLRMFFSSNDISTSEIVVFDPLVLNMTLWT